LGGLCSLQQLSLADNLLEALPESMGQLLALKTLWLWVISSPSLSVCGWDIPLIRWC
jgi:hypothetical protein